MFDFASSPLTVRDDLSDAMRTDFDYLAGPGGSLTGQERTALAKTARDGGGGPGLERFARHLYADPATVDSQSVRDAVDDSDDAQTVETIGIVSRLSAVDRFHQVLGVELPPIPEPRPGRATGEIQSGLKRRRGHVPMPNGPIPFSLDLVPGEGRALRRLHGPMYMTEQQMGDPDFGRDPGLDTPQLETVAARISLLNECFY